MIRVIATDLDGTLLNKEHKLDQETYKILKKATKSGMRLMIATGRNYTSAMHALGNWDIECDYIVGSGAEIRDTNGKILQSRPMEQQYFEDILKRLQGLKLSIRFCAASADYTIGNREDAICAFLNEAKLFFADEDTSDEEILESDLFQNISGRTICVDSLQELLDLNAEIFKIYISSSDIGEIKKADQALANIPNIVSASSFPNNVEVTHKDAQKGPVLKEYIESLGYTMEEVIVFGDSMNDYSMISMDFGMTVAMGNAMEPIKKAAKCIGKRNDQQGVAEMILTYLEAKGEVYNENNHDNL